MNITNCEQKLSENKNNLKLHNSIDFKRQITIICYCRKNLDKNTPLLTEGSGT